MARRARGTAEFRGTLRYCSPNVHEKKEQGRRDDLWSLFYVFIELHCGLPWQTLRDKQKVEILKMNISDKDLVLNFPAELHGVIPHLRTLNYYQRPDYTMFYEGLVAVMKRVGAKPSDPYDWEKPETVKNIQKRLKAPYAWENASEFFKSDPIKVNSAPPHKSKKKRQELMKAFKPLEEEVNKSSDHTTASTDLEKRADIPTELTMNDVDKKMFEVFGIRKTEDEKLRDLGVRFSGEILKNIDLDETGPKNGKSDKKKEVKKTDEEVKAKGDAKVKKDIKEVKKTGEDAKSKEDGVTKEKKEIKKTDEELKAKDDAKVNKDKKEVKSKEDVKVKLKKEDKVDEAKKKEAPPRAKLPKEKVVAKSKEIAKSKSKEQTTTPSKESVEPNVKKKAAEGKAKPVVKEGAAEKKKEKTASKEEVKKKDEKKVSKEEVQKKEEKKASKEGAQKKDEKVEKKGDKEEKKEEKEEKKEEKKTPSMEKAASKEKQDSGGRNGKEKRERDTDDTPRATKSGSNPGSLQQAVDHKE